MLSEVKRFLETCLSKTFIKNFRALVIARSYTVKEIFLNFYVTKILTKMFSNIQKQASTDGLIKIEHD